MSKEKDNLESPIHVEDIDSDKVEGEGEGEFKFSPADEKRLVRKLDWYILPLASLLYLFAYLDRSNIGNARLQGFPEDTLHGDPSGSLFAWVNSAFFFSYIICQIPGTIASKLIPPHRWIAMSAMGWGLTSTLMVRL